MIPDWLPQESRVLNAFLQHGPMTATEAAERVGLNVRATWNHIHKLVEAGVLQGYQIEGQRWGQQRYAYDLKGR